MYLGLAPREDLIFELRGVLGESSEVFDMERLPKPVTIDDITAITMALLYAPGFTHLRVP